MNTAQVTDTPDAQTRVKQNTGLEISKAGVAAIVFAASIIGCWAVSCLFSGALRTGGPGGLISNLLKAITG